MKCILGIFIASGELSFLRIPTEFFYNTGHRSSKRFHLNQLSFETRKSLKSPNFFHHLQPLSRFDGFEEATDEFGSSVGDASSSTLSSSSGSDPGFDSALCIQLKGRLKQQQSCRTQCCQVKES